MKTTLEITGLTCGHCVSHLNEELSAIPGVGEINIDLVKGGISVATVESKETLNEKDLHNAVAEAGDYEILTIRN